MNKFGLFLLLALHSAFPQISMPRLQNPFQLSATVSKDSAGIGETISARVKLGINKGHYVYKSKTSLRPASVQGLKFGAARYSPSVGHFDRMTGKKEAVFLDSMIAVIPITISAYTADTVRVTLLCTYQGCMESMCFLPATESITFLIHVHPASAQAGAAGHIKSDYRSPRPPDNQPRSGSESKSRGGLLGLFLAFIGGLLTCLTPCVYPLIPVTISVFGATAAKSKLRAFVLSCTYVAGICVMFSTLGFVMASSGKVFGQFLANSWVVGGLAAVFCLFGVSLLGAFDFHVPAGLQNRLATIGGRRSGFQKVFLMGLVAGIIAAPCTGPTLGAVLTYVATSGNQWFGVLMLFSFSLGLGIPFLLLGTFSSLVVSRPKPGPWMESIKSILAIVMFVMALYFLRSIVPFINGFIGSTPLYFTLMGICILGGTALGGIHLSFHGASLAGIVRKSAGTILIIGGSFGIIGSMLFGPTLNQSDRAFSERGNSIQWESDIDAGLAHARDLKKPIIIDFFADWCLACKELDKTTFSDPAIRTELARFVCIRQDLTTETEKTKRIAREYSLRGIPVLEFYNSSGSRLIDARTVGFVPSGRLLDLLQKIQ
jgi:thiol:disulfide interchange protein DsbD